VFGKETVMETIIVEIRAAEGGDDAKQLVNEQVTIYENRAARRRL
jgi:protein subunit release factor A